MRNFNLERTCNDLFTKEIVDYISLIHEYKGKQQLYIDTQPEILEKLVAIAKIKSTVSSNRIEGIHTTEERTNELLKNNSEPRNRSEQEIQGYRYALEEIHNSYEYMTPNPNIILQLHQEMYKSTPSSFGGKFKTVDNSIIEEDESGKQIIRFKPLSAFVTPAAIEQLTASYIDCIDNEKVDPLLLIPVFILDFLCIHPFNDGNGRMSRLLTLLLLYRSEYMVGKYISIERLIEKYKTEYYDCLQDSSSNWHTNANDYKPFVKYYLGIILHAYREFEERTAYLRFNKKAIDRIRDVFNESFGEITKGMVQEKCPDISINMIEFHIKELVNEGIIKKVKSGRYASYIKNQ
jgi:Fic family protein